MLDVRLYEIYKADNQKYKSLKNLLIKNNMNVFMREKGYLVPKVHFEFKIGDNLSLNKFPKKFVVKPIDGFNSNGVYVVENGVDLFRRIKLPRDFGRYLTSSLGDSYFNKEMIVEELIDDVDLDHDPYLKIPRDFKVFVADGKVYWINVYNRNARGQLRSMVSYDPSWERIPQMTKSYLPGVTEKKPNYFDEMLVQAENISREYPFFLRLDFYLSKKGPVFGEFTPFPGDFINATDFGLRTMSQMVRAFPD